MATYSFFKTGSLPSQTATTFWVVGRSDLTVTVIATALVELRSNAETCSPPSARLTIVAASNFSPENRAVAIFEDIRIEGIPAAGVWVVNFSGNARPGCWLR